MDDPHEISRSEAAEILGTAELVGDIDGESETPSLDAVGELFATPTPATSAPIAKRSTSEWDEPLSEKVFGKSDVSITSAEFAEINAKIFGKSPRDLVTKLLARAATQNLELEKPQLLVMMRHANAA